MKDDSGAYTVFTEQGSAASHMTAASVMDAISRLRRCTGQAADAISAHTQVKMKDAAKLFGLSEKHWEMRTSFEPQSTSDSLRPDRSLFHTCTLDISVAVTLDFDEIFNTTRAVTDLCVSAETGNSASFQIRSSVPLLEPLRDTFYPCVVS